MKKFFLTLLMGALCAPIFIQAVHAHQLKSSITTVLFNANSNNLEVMHRFYLHDAEHAVAKLGIDGPDIYTDEKTQQVFAEYVMERFKLLKDNSQLLTLQPVGFEVEGKFFWVYQETAKPEQINSLQVRHSALQDIWPEQINTVNIEGTVNGEKAIKTLSFDKTSKVLEVAF